MIRPIRPSAAAPRSGARSASAPLRRGAVKTPPATKAYKVLVAFAYKHVMQSVGVVLQMTDAEAKYHLLAKRVALVVQAETAPAEPVAAPAIDDSHATDGDDH